MWQYLLIDRTASPEAGRAVATEFIQRHTGWSRDDLFARYGSPDGVTGDNVGITLVYEQQLEAVRARIRFLLHDDRVIFVDFH